MVYIDQPDSGKLWKTYWLIITWMTQGNWLFIPSTTLWLLPIVFRAVFQYRINQVEMLFFFSPALSHCEACYHQFPDISFAVHFMLRVGQIICGSKTSSQDSEQVSWFMSFIWDYLQCSITLEHSLQSPKHLFVNKQRNERWTSMHSTKQWAQKASFQIELSQHCALLTANSARLSEI